jgi:hypothetical protein
MGWVVIFLGLNFLAQNFGLPNIDLGDLFNLWPLGLVWVGWNMLRDGRKKHEDTDTCD